MVKRSLFVVWLLVTLGACSFNLTIKLQEEWLFAKLQRQGNTLVLTGPNLYQTAISGNLYTYTDGQWIALEWGGYLNGQNTWLIPESLQSKDDLKATVDFLGDRFTWSFYGAYPGTSVKPK